MSVDVALGQPQSAKSCDVPSPHSEISIGVFYSRRFPKSLHYAEDLLDGLRRAGIHVDALDVETSSDQWRRLGLRSVPAVVYFRPTANGDRIAVGNIVRYAPVEEVLGKARLLSGTTDSTEATPNPAQKYAAPVEALPYQIESSSGSHRYERWNEWYLRDENPATGWCCPSRKQPEHVTLRFRGEVAVTEIRIRPRLRCDGSPVDKGFPRALSISRIDEQGNERLLWSQSEIELTNPYEDFVVSFDKPIELKRLKLVIEDRHQQDNRGYPSISYVRVLGYHTGAAMDSPPIRSIAASEFTAGLFNKIGLFAGENVSVELFNLLQGQQTPAFCCNVHKVVIVHEGVVEGWSESGSVGVLRRGDVIVVEPGTPYSLSAIAERSSVLVIFGTNNLQSIWEAR